MFDQDGLWQLMEPYAHSAHEIVFRLSVVRGIAAELAAGGAITTNCIDHELACLQVLIATEKLAAALASVHGVADREVLFEADVSWSAIDHRAMLPMPIESMGDRYRLRPNDFIPPDEFRRLRDDAREALRLESLRPATDAIPVNAIGSAADKLHDWLRSHMLIIRKFAGVALLDLADDQFNCRLVSIDDINWPGETWSGVRQ